jgi:hypothetical protein
VDIVQEILNNGWDIADIILGWYGGSEYKNKNNDVHQAIVIASGRHLKG